FGGVANYYYIPIVQFFGDCVRESPGLLLSFALTLASLIYLMIRRRSFFWSPDIAALVIAIGFAIIVFKAPNKQIRYAFPAIVAAPFLTAVLLSGKRDAVLCRPASLAAGLAFCTLVLVGVPMRHRPDPESIGRANAVLSAAATCHAENIVLATD